MYQVYDCVFVKREERRGEERVGSPSVTEHVYRCGRGE